MSQTSKRPAGFSSLALLLCIIAAAAIAAALTASLHRPPAPQPAGDPVPVLPAAEEMIRLEREVVALRQQVESANCRLKAAEEKLEIERKVGDPLRDRRQALELALDVAQAKLLAAQTENDKTRERIAALDKQIAELNPLAAKAESLGAILGTTRTELNQAKEQHAATRKLLAAANERAASLETQVKALEKQLKDLQETLREIKERSPEPAAGAADTK